jgi:hypothetical protein
VAKLSTAHMALSFAGNLPQARRADLRVCRASRSLPRRKLAKPCDSSSNRDASGPDRRPHSSCQIKGCWLERSTPIAAIWAQEPADIFQ